MQPFYLVKHYANGKVYRVAADLQSKTESPGTVTFFDQELLRKIGADAAVIEFRGLDSWLDSIPTR